MRNFTETMETFEEPEKPVPVKQTEFVPVSHETLSKILFDCGLDTSGKVRIVNIVQENNKNKVGSYTIELKPGKILTIENGKVIQ